MAKYNPECNDCGCYLKYNENFDAFCPNIDCPSRKFKDEQYAERIMLDQSE